MGTFKVSRNSRNSNQNTYSYPETDDHLTKFGTQRSGNGQLAHPWGTCLASDGKLYVTEYSNEEYKCLIQVAQVFSRNLT